MRVDRRTVEVWADWDGMPEPARMGFLHATPARGKEVFAFEYDADWLTDADAKALDPKLALFSGPQYPSPDSENFGLFLDSSPDRWGRTLLQRREAHLARTEKRRLRPLLELDYLLGVYDAHRLGGLRFQIGDGPFLDDNQAYASPPWTSLRELEQASLRLEEEGAEDQRDYATWLRLLIAPGRSLGGARPKASVLDPKGALWIAKFPSTQDTDDVGAWEYVVNQLARRAGVDVVDARLERFGSARHTFLTRRFDRTATRARRHFASAMTMLDRADGEAGASYLDLAAVLVQGGAHTAADLAELWRRIVFFVCVSNIDDHLRNHGFLLEAKGWRLAPAYDVNPVPYGDGLSLNISETDNAQDLELVRDVAPHFRVKPGAADEILDEVVTAVQGWPREATKAGIARAEQERMAPAFRVADARPSRGRRSGRPSGRR